MQNAGPITALLTLNAQNEAPAFFVDNAPDAAQQILHEHFGEQLMEYVIMPDHLHVLFRCKTMHHANIESMNLQQKLTDAIQSIRDEGLTPFLLFPGDIEDSRAYIVQNPIRSGLTSCVEDYPWSSASRFEKRLKHVQAVRQYEVHDRLQQKTFPDQHGE